MQEKKSAVSRVKRKNRARLAAVEPVPEVRRSGLFQARDGTFLYYEVRGEGRPLILCYGLTCRRAHWRYQIGHFARRYQVITFDYRGHHFSSTPRNEQHLTLEWCARDVQDLMNYLELPEAVCLGHSMGVPVVTRAALLEPERVKASVFICGSVNNPFHHMFFTDRLMPIYRVSEKLFDLAPDTMSKVWYRFTEKNPISYFLTSRFGFNPRIAEEEDILGYMEGVNRTPMPIFASLLRDYTRFDGRTHLKNLRCPTLVVAGDKDFITPLAVQQEMARLLPRGEMEVIRHGSHNAHMDYPSLVNQKIEDFLTRNEYR